MRPFRLLLLFAVALSFSPSGFSRSAEPPPQSATLSGTITDSSGAPVAGAEITAQPLARNRSGNRYDLPNPPQTREIRTGSGGRYALTLPPGTYRIAIAYPSFAAEQRQVTVSAGETRVWNARLRLEALSAKVTVTAAAEPEAVATSAAPVDVITRQQMDEQQQIFQAQALAAIPGAAIAQLGPMGGITSLFLDGGSSGFTKVLVDGAPVNQTTPTGAGVLDFSNLTLDDVDKIEVVHGASSALYGSDAMDGVVQIFTHRGSTRRPQLSLESDGGMFATSHTSGDLSGLLGALDYSAAAAYFGTNGQDSPAAAPGSDYFRDATLSGNFGWKFSESDHLRLALRNNASDAGTPGQTLLASQSPFAVVPGQHADLHDFSSDLSWDFSAGPHWQNQVSGFEYRGQQLDAAPGAFGYSFESKYNRAGLEARSSYLLQGGSITAGYYFETENYEAIGQPPSKLRRNQAGYLEIQRQFARRLNVIAGGRAEDNGYFGTRFVPRLGASYLLRDGSGIWGATRLRASYGDGIEEPPMLPPGCSPGLRPETSGTFNAGVEQGIGRMRFSTTFFYNDFRDLVSFDPGAASSDPHYCPEFFGGFYNTDQARAFGENTSLRVHLASWLEVMGSYSYDDSKVVKATFATDPSETAGNRLILRPLHAATFIADAHFRRMDWNLAGYYAGRVADSDFLSTYNVNGTCASGPCIHSNPSWMIWNLGNSFQIARRLSTVAAVDNLFNRHYSVAAGYPALRLNYRLGLKYTWGGE